MVQYCLHEGDEETVYTLYKYKLLDDWKNKYLEVIVKDIKDFHLDI